jgi:NAD(P)-dependent dehydrogenase (short-subunit alcohol dehydrogenase family)
MGLAFANRFADEGMSVVLADIEAEPLAIAEAGIRQKGGKALAVKANVMSEDDVNRLAEAAFSTFGNVHILCNNAGVVAGAQGLRTFAWDSSMADWEWTLGVNFMGVLYGIRAFVPRMLANGEEGHIVNTASLAGLLPGANAYSVSKWGVVCLTEGIYADFQRMGAKISASVLCPGLINTNIFDAERNRPPEFGPHRDRSSLPPERKAEIEAMDALLKGGIQPEEVARQVFEAVRDERFYIIPTQPMFLDLLNTRLEDVRLQRNPTIAPTFVPAAAARD